MPEVHAKLSASGAKRWMTCPKSVKLEKLFPEDSTTYAEEGTQAHAWCEKILRSIIEEGIEGPEEFQEMLSEITDKDMRAAVATYVDYCLEVYNQHSLTGPDALALIEQRLDFSEWVPGGFGTGDFSAYGGEVMDIIDFKYGKGVRISARNNPQLRLYALGALNDIGWIYPVKKVRMHIIQPRLDSISVEELEIEELKAWADNEVRPKAKTAEKGAGSYNPTPEGCKFCKAKALCKHRASSLLDTVIRIMKGNEGE